MRDMMKMMKEKYLIQIIHENEMNENENEINRETGRQGGENEPAFFVWAAQTKNRFDFPPLPSPC